MFYFVVRSDIFVFEQGVESVPFSHVGFPLCRILVLQPDSFSVLHDSSLVIYFIVEPRLLLSGLCLFCFLWCYLVKGSLHLTSELGYCFM